MIDDKLFKQVLFDYRSALQKLLPEDLSQVCLIMESPSSALLTRYIMKSLPLPAEVIFRIQDLEDLNTIIHTNKFREAIIINEFIGSYVEKAHVFEHLSVICTCNCPQMLGKQVQTIVFNKDKASVAFELMSDLLLRPDYSEQENNRYFID